MSYLEKVLKEFQNLKLDCEYWDIRVEDSFETAIDMVDDEIVTCAVSPSIGAFLRIRKNGFWLYESTTALDQIKSSLEKLCKQDIPKHSSNNQAACRYETFVNIAFEKTKLSSVALSEKVDLVQKYFVCLKQNPKVVSTNIRYRDIYKVKAFMNSAGTQFEFDFNQGGLGLLYTMKEDGKLFDDRVRFYGSDFSQLLKQEAQIADALAESEKFLNAPSIDPGKYKVLLDPEVTGVFTHESFGHKSEADFMIGNNEALKEWKLGTKIASDILTIVDFGGHEKTSGYCPIDDDGSPAQKNYLIKNGVLTGRLHSVDTANQLGEKPTGNSRALNFEFEPIVRMTSTYIEAGEESIDSILNRCEGALLVEGVKHGSGLSTFTIAPNRGYKIGANGKKTPVRLSVLSGSVFETLNNIEAVSSDFHLHSGAVGGCGKMEQWPLPVSHGGPYVLVKEMQVT